MQSVKTALLALWRAPKFSATIIVTLAVGMTTTLAMFAVLWHVVYRSLPIPEASELHVLSAHRTGQPNAAALSGIEALELQSQLRTGIQVGSYFWNGTTFMGTGTPQSLTTVTADPRLFVTLQVKPALGRLLTTADDGKDNVVLTDKSWRELFSADPSIVGKDFVEQGGNQTIVGVLPAALELLMPAVTYYKAIDSSAMRKQIGVYNNARFYNAIVRVPKTLRGKAAMQLDQASRALNVRAGYAAHDWRFEMKNMRAQVIGDVRLPLHAMLALSLLVFLIAIGNVSHMIAARIEQRIPQLAVRDALGASTGQIAGQIMLEGLLLSFAACALAATLSAIAFRVIDLSTIALPFFDDFRIGWANIALTLGLIGICAALIGIIPAWPLLRGGSQSIHLRARGSQRMGRIHRWLAVPAIALSILAISVGLLYLQSSRNFLTQPLGLDPNNIAAAQMFLQGDSAKESSLTWLAAAERLKLEGQRIPAVKDVAVIGRIPFNPVANLNIDVDGSTVARTAVNALTYIALGDIHRLLGLKVLRGRGINERDTSTSTPAIVINERFAAAYFGRQDPLGKAITLPGWGSAPSVTFRVVGVMADARSESPALLPKPEIVLSMAQYPVNGISLVIKTQSDPRLSLKALKDATERAIPGQSIFRTFVLSDLLNELNATRRFFTGFSNGFAALALVLASAGIYALLVFEMSLRQREFALRSALGASPIKQLQVASRSSRSSLLSGGVLGVLAAVALAKTFQSLLFGQLNISSAVIGALTIVSAMTLFAALIATRSNLKRAPIESLRA